MEKILTEKEFQVPFNKKVIFGISGYDKSIPVKVKIIHPPNFDKHILDAFDSSRGAGVCIPRTLGKKFLHPINLVKLRVFQEVSEAKKKVVVPVEEKVEIKSKNPIVPIKEEKKSIIGAIVSAVTTNHKAQAIEKAQKRKERLANTKKEVEEALALKPSGLDGKRILTGDNCDYSRGAALIKILMGLQMWHNNQENLNGPGEGKLLCERYDALSFSGIEQIISFYIALGSKVKGDGDLEYLLKWYKEECSKIYSTLSMEEVKKKGMQILNGITPKHFKKKSNPGLSIKNVEKIVGSLFENKTTGKPFRLKDMYCEVYQPLFFEDEQTKVYSRAETPDAKIIDVILNTGLDPLYFQSRNIEGLGISLGPSRRSYDLPLAQHNDNITIVSLGASPTYNPPKEGREGINPAQVAFLNKRMSYRHDYTDVEAYMKSHPSKVNYLRIEARQTYAVMANSISKKDLKACEDSASECTFWSNTQKTAIGWN